MSKFFIQNAYRNDIMFCFYSMHSPVPCTCTTIINNLDDPAPDLNKCKAENHKCVCNSIIMHMHLTVVCRCFYLSHDCTCRVLILRKDVRALERWGCVALSHSCQCELLAGKGTWIKAGMVLECENRACKKWGPFSFG